MNSTVISVLWDGLKDCRDVSGRIKWYRVQGAVVWYRVKMSLEDGGTMGLETLLTGLTPNTTYTIRVTAVEGYVGLYSSPIYVWTTELGI